MINGQKPENFAGCQTKDDVLKNACGCVMRTSGGRIYLINLKI